MLVNTDGDFIPYPGIDRVHYQDLVGAQSDDMRISFSAHKAEDFFNGFPPVAEVLGVRFRIKAISLTGLSLAVPLGISIADVAGAQTLTLYQGGKAFYDCPVILQRQPTGKAELNVVYDQRGVDLDIIARRNAAALASSPVPARKPVLSTAVPAEYRVFCTEVLDYISDRRQFIDSNIAPHEKFFTPEEADTVAVGLEGTSRDAWRELCFRGNQLVLPHMKDPETLKELKQFTEKLLTYELVKGTNWHRSYFKPMGYPGDFRIMNYMYDHQPEGATTYSRYLHMLGLISGEPIVSRMEYISRHLNSLNDGTDNIYHVMSIGSGPAREVQRFLARMGAGRDKDRTLADQLFQPRLDVHVNVFQRGGKAETPRLDL